jgi:hypothetical protein
MLETKKQKSSKSHSNRIQEVSDYLFHVAVVGCIMINKQKGLSCNCLKFLEADDVGRRAAANFLLLLSPRNTSRFVRVF